MSSNVPMIFVTRRIASRFSPSYFGKLSLGLSWYPSSCSGSFFFFRMTMRKVFSVPGVFPLTLFLSCAPLASELGLRSWYRIYLDVL